MSQWTTIRIFLKQDKVAIATVALAETCPSCFSPLTPESKIVAVIMVERGGDESLADDLLEQVRAEFEGRTVADWLTHEWSPA